jgi:hypothetical protein
VGERGERQRRVCAGREAFRARTRLLPCVRTMKDDHRQRAARRRAVTLGRVLFALALLAAGAHLAGDLAEPLRSAATVVSALTVLTWCSGPVAAILARSAGDRVAAANAADASGGAGGADPLASRSASGARDSWGASDPPAMSTAPSAAVALDGPDAPDTRGAPDLRHHGAHPCIARLAVALVLGPLLFVAVVVLVRALGLDLDRAVPIAFALCGVGHLALGRGTRTVAPTGVGPEGESADVADSVSIGSPRKNQEGTVPARDASADRASAERDSKCDDSPRTNSSQNEAARTGPAATPSMERAPRGQWALRSALVVALALAGLAAAPWVGAGPTTAGALDHDLAERFVLAAASTTELDFDDPLLANVAPLAPRAPAHLDGVLGEALFLGPFAASAFQTLWSVFALGLAGALFVVRRRPAARAAVATAPLVAVFGAVAAGAVTSPVADPMLRAASDHTFAPVLALLVTGLWTWRESAAGARVDRGWLGLSGVAFALAFALDSWIGALALALAAVASARGPHAIDRLLALVLAAIPALALPLVGWPEPTTAPGGFAAIGPILVLATVATALRRGSRPARAQRADSGALVVGDDLRLAAATLVSGSLAASWAGGGAALAALLACGTVAALVLVRAWPRAQWILVALCAVAAVGPARDALAAARSTSVLVDAGPLRLGVRLDAPDVVRAAWDGEPGPGVFDPRWKEPLDSQTKDASDWAALWNMLQNDAALRALDPILLVAPGAPGPRYGRGASVSTARAAPHEGALLANLDLFVVADTPTRDVSSDVPSAAQRLETVAELLGDDGVIAPVHRRRLEALARPFVVPVGPQQRARVRGLDRRLVQFGCIELVRCGEVSLYGWPASSFDARASD